MNELNKKRFSSNHIVSDGKYSIILLALADKPKQ